jgi:hypothetical protein
MDSSDNNSYAGDGTTGVFIWGWQIEAGSFPTSYIQTTGTTLTRNADVAVMGPTTGGTELVTNGTYDTDTTGWDVEFGCTISQNSGNLRIAATTNGVGAKTTKQTISNFVVGRRYRASYLMVGNSVSGSLQSRLRIREGGSTTVAEIFPVTNGQTGTVDFTATNTTLDVQIRWDGLSGTVTGDYIDVDNVSVRELYPFEQYNPSEGTVVCEIERGGDTAFDHIWDFGDGSTDNTMTLLTLNAANLYFGAVEGGSGQLAFNSIGAAAGETNTTAYAYKQDDFHVSSATNGNLEKSFEDTTINLPVGINTIGIGNRVRDETSHANSHIKRLTYYPKRLNNDVCDSKVTS